MVHMSPKQPQAPIAPDEAHLQIGEVAERTGVTQRTLRFYEEKGLLMPATRMEGGFRLYSEDDIQRVEQIKQLQTLLGFSLAEIKEMVEAKEIENQLRKEYRPEADPAQKRTQLLRAIEVTQTQFDLIRQKVGALKDMESKLEERLTRFDGWLTNLDKQIAEERKSKTKTKV